MNSEVSEHLKFDSSKMIICSSVASERTKNEGEKIRDGFRVLSVGRFVWLKGFDITIRSFAAFYNSLSKEEKKNVSLTLVGDGPARKQLEKLAEDSAS